MKAPQLLPRDHPDAPKFWMNESSGILKPVIEAYVNGKELTDKQIALMRAYLYQWVAAPVWIQTAALEILKLRVAAIKTNDDLRTAISKAVEMNIDPL